MAPPLSNATKSWNEGKIRQFFLDNINMLVYVDMFSTNGVIHKQQQDILV